MKHLNLIKGSFLLVSIFSLVLLVFLPATNLFAQCTECTVSGTINGDTWSSGSTICVGGDINVTGEVSMGGGLVIEAGVEVLFCGNYVFKIQGEVDAIGTEQDKIMFKREENNTDGWQGIFFDYGSSLSELVYCEVNGSINSGIRIIETLPTIENCTIRDNSTDSVERGGGIYVELSSNDVLVIKDCIIDNNVSNPAMAENGDYKGGGIYAFVGGDGNLILNNCKIGLEEEGFGNRVYSRFQSGTRLGKGGGIYKTGDGKLTLKNCFVENNDVNVRQNGGGAIGRVSKSYGGGIYVDAGELEALNSVIKDNRAYTYTAFYADQYVYGGGIYLNSGTVNVTNCTVRNNIVEAENYYEIGVDGGGLCKNDGTMTVINSIIFFNQKCINGPCSNSQVCGNPTVTYSDVQDGYTGDGNIDQNPAFIDDYHISSSSPCVDAGNNDGISGIGLPPTDIDGELRIFNETVDMGADECFIECTDTDNDGVCDDGGDNFCATGETVGCDDNCPHMPNGPDRGICTAGQVMVGDYECKKRGHLCTSHADCGTGGVCSMDQEDTDQNGIGDVCDDDMECIGNFDCDNDVDGTDAVLFKLNFFRKNCPACLSTCVEQ